MTDGGPAPPTALTIAPRSNSIGNSRVKSLPRWPVIAVLVLIFVVAAVYAYFIYAPCDDTYIYLVYAKNYVAGHGLTFNGMKVQGFTSVLWMFLITLLGKLGVALPAAANALSVVAGLLAVVAAYRLGRVVGLSEWAALAPPALLALTADFSFYMGNGLESVLFAAMLTLATTLAVAPEPQQTLRSWKTPLILALTVFARPEGSAVALVVLAILAWRSRDYKRVALTGGVVVALVAPVVIALRVYYGDWLPNTYYVKAGAGLANVDLGLKYFLSFAETASIVLFLTGFVAIFRWRALGQAGIAMLIMVVMWFGYVIVQGGDNMTGYRQFLPIVPVMYVFIAYGFRGVPLRALAYAVLFVGIFNLFTWNIGSAFVSPWNVKVKVLANEWARLYPIRVNIGRQLKRDLPADAVIAVSAAGIIPYYSELATIDMLGLNNRAIAHDGDRDRSLPYGHQVGDGRYVLQQNPDAIIFGGQGRRTGDLFLSDQQITRSPAFTRNYSPVALPGGGVAYYRNDHVGR